MEQLQEMLVKPMKLRDYIFKILESLPDSMSAMSTEVGFDIGIEPDSPEGIVVSSHSTNRIKFTVEADMLEDEDE